MEATLYLFVMGGSGKKANDKWEQNSNGKMETENGFRLEMSISVAVLQEQSDKALQAVQDGRTGEGVSHDVVCESGAEDDQALAAMSLSQVERRAASAAVHRHQRTSQQPLYIYLSRYSCTVYAV